ncbi:MAG: hypothetical protein GF411_02255 [Candidatus Lokiarchaeota archaeon]|nr:hypothetical protein [Candidatus Lokiarchaeota archaeon]
MSKKVCSIVGCEKPSKRSFATSRIGKSISNAGLQLEDARSRKAYLCRDHWKKVKKYYKKDTKAERLRWGH